MIPNIPNIPEIVRKRKIEIPGQIVNRFAKICSLMLIKFETSSKHHEQMFLDFL